MKCEKCGSEMKLQEFVYISDPVRYGYKCPKCGNVQYSMIREENNQMDYEKAYKDALEKIIDGLQPLPDGTKISGVTRAFLEEVFPERKESEDEKIRKGIIELVKQSSEILNKKNQERMLAWLEKQGGKDKLIKELGEYKVKYTQEVLSQQLEKQREPKPTSDTRYEVKAGDSLSVNGQPFDYEHANITQKDFVQKDKCAGCNNIKGCIACVDGDNWAHYYYEDEQKATDIVEPKFKVGDWILYSGDHYEGVRHITKIDENGYYIERNGLPHGIIPFDHEICMRLWTIQDAKDGDVVIDKSDGTIGIFQSIGHHPNGGSFNDPSYCFLHCHYDDGFFYADFEDGNIMDSYDAIPATKEQRDLLFQEMEEAGYEWDAEKKELKKIHVIDDGKAEMDYCFTKMMAGKKASPTWSEEDDYNLQCMIAKVTSDIQKGNVGRNNELIDWLKSLKDRVQPNNLTVTDDELAQVKKDAYNDALNKIEYHSGEPTFDDGWSAAIWYLKKRNIQPQPKQEWSEEDEKMCQETIDWFEKKCFPYALESENPARESIKWLKSLKGRITWKPSKEQMHAFVQVYEWYNDNFAPSETLTSLYNDLKKL